MHAHLRGAVAGQFRRDLANELSHGQVLTDDGIGSAGCHCAHGIGQLRQFGPIDGRVQRHMHLDPAHMAEPDRLFQAVRIKISGSRPGVEARKAQIYRIRAAEHRRTEHFFAAHRGKDLDL